MTQAARGAGPFLTWRRLDFYDGARIWLARNHRKGVGVVHAPRAIWQSRRYNVILASGFAFGAMLFVIGSILSLSPVVASAWHTSVFETNVIFFAGSVFFTFSGYLQLFQAANVGEALHGTTAPRMRYIFGWRPLDPGWWSSATQFIGTILFNINTWDSLSGGGSWLQQDLKIWLPDVLGSILFLVSGYLALIETSHSWWVWRPRSLASWIVLINFTGCLAFMVSAGLAFIPPSGLSNVQASFSILLTLIGAACFLIAALFSAAETN